MVCVFSPASSLNFVLNDENMITTQTIEEDRLSNQGGWNFHGFSYVLSYFERASPWHLFDSMISFPWKIPGAEGGGIVRKPTYPIVLVSKIVFLMFFWHKIHTFYIILSCYDLWHQQTDHALSVEITQKWCVQDFHSLIATLLGKFLQMFQSRLDWGFRESIKWEVLIVLFKKK